MHVVLTCNFSPWSRYRGGGQRSTHMLASALSALGHQVSVVYTKPPWERVHVPPALPYRVRWAVLPAAVSRRNAPLRPLSAVSVAWAVRTLAAEGPVHVVHGQGEEAALVAATLPCPLVLTPRYPSYPADLAASGRVSLSRAGLWLRDPKYPLLAATARRAALVCTTSQHAARAVGSALGVEPARLRVVPNGVDPAFFDVARSPHAASGPLLFFGRVEPEKGSDVLLRAFADSAHSGRELHVVGEGHGAAALLRAADRAGVSARLRLHPWEQADALRARLGNAALAVLPSREESFGNAVAEAMAAGTPVVSTTAGSIPELVESGRTGWLVPADDASALRCAIDALLADPDSAEALGRAARSAVQQRCSWDQVARAYAAIYAEVCATHEPPGAAGFRP
jgi:glycosyltransferase involved in cell wall biosynthesis